MAELLLELLSEEIPARMQVPMAERLHDAMKEKLTAAGLFHTSLKSFVTPRRLVLSVEGLSLTQEDITVEKRGPRTDAPKQAVDGFLRSTGLTIDQLVIRNTEKGDFYFAVTKEGGRPTVEVLSEALEEIVPSLIWPKSMRWGSGQTRWVRPLRNICCVFGSKVLPFSFAGLESNDISYGHRFLAPESFKVTTFALYKKELISRFVVLDSSDRKRTILDKARITASGLGFTLIDDEALLDEVAGLVEWPEVLTGNIDRNFMHVPEEVLITSIRTHQKYFCMRDRQNKLAPNFAVVTNMSPSQTRDKNIIAGNERVLRARLSDASFFWEQDRKKPLEERVPTLDKIIFHAKLGTVGEKVSRIKSVATFLSVWVPHANLNLVERAALLCKADLATGMVGEFPELQGIMGGYYARHFGEPGEVVNAIKEHYSPLGPNDTSPSNPVSIAVAIADKIDSLTGLFAVGEKPTGSKDPFALRRAALGIIRIILENKLSVPLKLLIENSLRQYPPPIIKQNDGEDDKKGLLAKITGVLKNRQDDLVDELMQFFGERLKALIKADNIRHDLINAVFDGGHEDDLYRLVQRVGALDRFLATDSGADLLAAYRRATNIVKIEEKKDGTAYSGNPSERLLESEQEKTLYENMSAAKPDIETALKENRFEDAMAILARLRNPIDEFFDKVTVNSEAPDLRRNRLKLLSQMREVLNEIANFSLIEG